MAFPGGKQVRNGREECTGGKGKGKGGRARVMGAISPCQRARKDLFKKGTPASAENRHRGWHGAVCAPVHGCFRENHFFDPDPCHWAGVNCYSALDAENRTKATAISRMKTVRMADALLFRLRRARRMVEGQPCTRVIAREKSSGKGGRRSAHQRANSPCQRARKDLFKKGTPASAENRHRGWHGAVCAPVHGCRRRLRFSTPTHRTGPGSTVIQR